MAEQKGSNKVRITLIICSAVVLLAGIGSWVYVQHQQIAQKDRTLAQQKQLDQYNQTQENARNKTSARAQCESAAATSTNPYAGIGC